MRDTCVVYMYLLWYLCNAYRAHFIAQSAQISVKGEIGKYRYHIRTCICIKLSILLFTLICKYNRKPDIAVALSLVTYV